MSLFWLTVRRDTVRHGGEGMVAGVWDNWSHGIHSQVAERSQLCTSAYGMVPLTFRVDLPILINLVWKILHIYA